MLYLLMGRGREKKLFRGSSKPNSIGKISITPSWEQGREMESSFYSYRSASQENQYTPSERGRWEGARFGGREGGKSRRGAPLGKKGNTILKIGTCIFFGGGKGEGRTYRSSILQGGGRKRERKKG